MIYFYFGGYKILFIKYMNSESVMAPISVRQTTATLHKLATIGICKNFGQQREWFSYRRDMSGESLRFLVEEFVDALETCRAEMISRLPESIIKGYHLYLNLKRNTESLSPDMKRMINRKTEFLDQLVTLPIYSWNGERYDLPVLLGPLIDIFSEKPKKFDFMKVIKRGTSFMEIRYGNFVFRDFMNFSSPMSLGKR